MNIKHIICIDGGGTKTFAIKYTKYQDELKIVDKVELKEQSNVIQDEDGSIKTLVKIVKKLTYSVDTYIYIGLAGFQGFASKKEFRDKLSLELSLEHIEVVSDIKLLQDAFYEQDRDILVSIFGTGSAHFLSGNGKSYQFGGWGHILGDEGSGYIVGLEMIKQAIKEYEQELKPILLNEVYSFYNINDAQQLKKIIYPLNDKTIIASFTSHITRQAELNNSKYIKQIYRQIASSVISAYKEFIDAKKILIDEILIIGGLVIKNIPYQEELFSQLNNEFRIKKINLIDLYDFKNVSKLSLNPLTRIAYKKVEI